MGTASFSTPGMLGSRGDPPWIDTGTSCRVFSPLPGLLGMAPPLRLPFALLVGRARREPGFNFDGTPAEDMQFGDKPKKSASIKADPMFQHSDELLGLYLKQLMESLSVGRMETVAVAMQEQFCAGRGGAFHADALDAEIAGNDAFINYRTGFERELRQALREVGYDPRRLQPLPMGLLNFSSFWDKVGGLAITVHQVWSARAHLERYELDRSAGHWTATLKYTFYDHYGLDWEDILKHGGDRFPQYHTGDCFKAWYILQHYRSARPLLTVMRESVPLSGRIF